MKRELGMIKLKYPTEFRQFGNSGAVTFGHVRYLSLLDAKYVSRTYHEEAFKFAVTRNPYQRAISLYNYLCATKVYMGNEFVQFLEDVRLWSVPVGMYNVLGLSHANPQVDWLIDPEGINLVDKLYRLEEIHIAIDDLRDRFNIDERSTFSKHNVTINKKGCIELLESNSEVIPLIREIYYKDFVLLGYDIDDYG